MTSSTSNSNQLPIIAYFTIVGWIIALLMNNSNKTELTSFHLRQMLGIMLLYAAVAICDIIINFPILFWILYLGVMLLWVFGLVSAIRKEKVTVPMIGIHFQEWFKAL